MFLRTLPLLVPPTFEGEQLVWQTQGGPYRDILGPLQRAYNSHLHITFLFMYVPCILHAVLITTTNAQHI